jgi:3-hydroxyisobutyrate dehydrogenase/2-hydroxy-3-oxopropionate reductase
VKVGFAGLGRMGTPMARNLARAGLLTAVWNRTRERAEPLGVNVCTTPGELAADADVLITMLADEAASLAVYEAFAGTIRPGTVAIEMSTVGVDHVRRLAALLDGRGCTLLDAPVSGSTSLAEDASLSILVGGDEAALELVRPMLEAIGSTIFHLGPSGAGATTKLAVNTVIYALNQAVSEALVLAERAGVPRERAYEVFAASAAGAPFVHYRRAEFERPGSVPVAMRMALVAKDLDLILGLAASVGHRMPQAELDARVVAAAVAAGYGEADVSAVAEYLREVV